MNHKRKRKRENKKADAYEKMPQSISMTQM